MCRCRVTCPTPGHGLFEECSCFIVIYPFILYSPFVQENLSLATFDTHNLCTHMALAPNF